MIAAGLDENIDHVAVLVYGAPQILPLTLDGREEFVEVPCVAKATLSSPEGSGVFGTELPMPLSDGFVADYDRALNEEIFHISEAQTESLVEPNGMADDIRQESVLLGWQVWRRTDAHDQIHQAGRSDSDHRICFAAKVQEALR